MNEPVDYGAAREAFLAAAEETGYRLLRFRLPHEDSADLFQDYALWRRDPTRVLVHLSGVHGVEGFAGSAIQRALVAETPAANGPSLLFVHAVNPYGMAFYRRANSHNVDLNRNYRHGPAAPNPHYARFDAFLHPATPAGLRWGWASGLLQRLSLGPAATTQAIASGQVSHPRGLFFMGHQVQREIQLVQEILRVHCAEARTLLALDVHTGLGAYGEETLFPEGNTPWNALDAKTRALYQNQGKLSTALAEAVPKAEFRYALQEFGVRSAARTLGALRLENFEWHRRPAGTERPPFVRDAMLNAFFPADPAWRAGLVKRGVSRWREAEASLR